MFQGQEGSSWRAVNVPSMYNTLPLGRSLPLAVVCAEMLTPSNATILLASPALDSMQNILIQYLLQIRARSP